MVEVSGVSNDERGPGRLVYGLDGDGVLDQFFDGTQMKGMGDRQRLVRFGRLWVYFHR